VRHGVPAFPHALLRAFPSRSCFIAVLRDHEASTEEGATKADNDESVRLAPASGARSKSASALWRIPGRQVLNGKAAIAAAPTFEGGRLTERGEAAAA
jgi:hypothetical protein